MGSGDDQDKRTKPPNARDNVELTRTGKKPVLKVGSQYQLLASLLFHWLIGLKRNFSFMSILSFSCIVLYTWGGAFTYASCPHGYLDYKLLITLAF